MAFHPAHHATATPSVPPCSAEFSIRRPVQVHACTSLLGQYWDLVCCLIFHDLIGSVGFLVSLSVSSSNESCRQDECEVGEDCGSKRKCNQGGRDTPHSAYPAEFKLAQNSSWAHRSDLECTVCLKVPFALVSWRVRTWRWPRWAGAPLLLRWRNQSRGARAFSSGTLVVVRATIR